ncbi:MAG: DUF4860 domain-containing protein [Lachnospiraceae bacterium]|nr:DUF4860 domain-containing protein [Lachnospiraceae bacterium]
MKLTRKKSSTVDTLFLLALLCVFLISALFVVLFGAHIYKQTIRDTSDNFTVRTASAYITEKLRRFDSADNITITTQSSGSVVALRQTTEGHTYVTYLYFDESALKELTILDGSEFLRSAGTPILELHGFNAEEISPAFYAFHITDTNDNTTTFYVSAANGQTGR